MAYSVTKIGGFGRPLLYREFLIDTIDDISSLPITGISPGSNAYCVEENSRYVFTNNKEWEILSGGGSSGGGLPDVTSADNGKVLTVVDGEWDAADAGGGEMLVVNTVYDKTSESYLCDASWNDIKNAFDSAAQVFLKIVSTTDPGGEQESTQTAYNLLQHLETATSVEGTNYRCTFFGNYYVDTTDPDQNMYANY